MSQSVAAQPEKRRGPMRVRLRSDLVACRQMSGAETRWAVKDPVALNYFHFGEREWFLLNQFDGKKTIEELKEEFQHRFAPYELSDAEINIFLQRVHSDGLIILDQHGQGQKQIERSQKLHRNQVFGRFISILAIRFKGIDPHRILDVLSPIGSILFHPLTMLAVLLLGIITLIAGVLQAETIASRLPDFAWFIQGENLIWMMLALSIVKILHEFGHGLACRYFKGECHEMGIMILVFTPCLYCNVSDSWMLPNRWHRILVSSAGIYVELILATICFTGWYFTHPGILNSVLLNVVFICSVNTIFLNGNPLLRYDGYYILSDLIDVPNLGAQSRAALWGPLAWWLTRHADPNEKCPPRRWGLAGYAAAAIVYRFFVVTTIIWLVYSTLKSHDLRALGQVVIAIILLGVVLPLMVKTSRLFKIPGGLSMIRWARLGILTAVLVGGLIALFSIPFPTYVKAPALVEAPEAAAIYAPADGRLVWTEREGASLDENDMVCSFESKQLERELRSIDHEIALYEVEKQTLELSANFDQSLSARVIEVEGLIEDAQNRLAVVQQDIDRLEVKTDVSGVVIRPRARTIPVDRERFLSTWQGTPIDPDNEGCFLQRGDLICYVGTPDQMEIVLFVTQEQIELVKVGNKVEIRLDQFPNTLLEATVAEVSRDEVERAPETLTGAGDFAVRPDEIDGFKPVEASYRVALKMKNPLPDVIHASGGRGRIVADNSTLGQRCLRYLRRTVRFDL